MLSWFIQKKIAAFEAEFGYDAGYLHEMLEIDPGAVMAFAKATEALKGYRKDLSDEVYYAAMLASSVIGDCGPCTQLAATMALRQGVDRRVLQAVVTGDDSALGDDTGLAVSFVRASLARVPEADTLRDQVLARFGKRGLVSLTFALLVSQVYPIVKYALGHGKLCQRVVFDDDSAAIPSTRAVA